MASRRSGELIGRDAQWEAGVTALGELVAGRGALLVLSGPAGIGKSRLATDLADRARSGGSMVLTGRAVRSGATQPYRPLAGAVSHALRSAPDIADADDGLRAGLANLLPGLVTGPLVPLSPLLVAETLLRLSRAADSGAGVVVVLEDLHWADSETLSVLDYLADYLHEEPLLVLATTRPDGAGERIDEWGARRTATVLHLGPLDAPDVRRMIRACAGDLPLPPEVVEAVVTRSEGVPFLVEELLASGADAVPASFAQGVADRLADLGEPAADVLRTASLLGREVDWNLLRDAAGLPTAAVLDALARGIDHQLIEETQGGQLRFRHALTADAVRATMARPRVVELAAGLLDAIACRPVPADRVALCAELAVTAGRPAEASRHLVAQAEAALVAGAVSTAVHAGRDAHVMAGPGTPEGIAADWLLLRALDAAGDNAEVDRVGARLLRALRSRPGAVPQAHLRLVLARAAARTMDLPAARRLCEDALRTPDLDEEVALRLQLTLAEIAFDAQEHADAVRRAEAVLARAEADPATGEIACSALELLGRHSMLVAHDLAGASRYLTEELHRARRSGLDLFELRALHQLAHLDIARLHDRERLDEAAAQAERIGALAVAVDLQQLRAIAHMTAHELTEATAWGQRALVAARRHRLGEQSAVLVGLLAAVDAMADRTGDAARRIADELAAHRHSAHIEAAVTGSATVLSALVRDDLPAALAAVQRTRALLPRQDMIVQPLFLGWFHGIAAVVVAAAGARELVEGRDWVDIDDVYLTSSFAVARAIVAGRRGDRAAAEELFAAGDAGLAGAPWVRALFRRHAGEAALSAGWGDPQRILTEAHAFFASSGNHDLARACATVRPSRRYGPPGLTAREAEVLALVTTGMTNREIAQRLHLSPRTVEKHVDRLRAKTGTANRTELVAVVLGRAPGASAAGG